MDINYNWDMIEFTCKKCNQLTKRHSALGPNLEVQNLCGECYKKYLIEFHKDRYDFMEKTMRPERLSELDSKE